MESKIILKTVNLCKDYSGLRVVQDVNLIVPEGEVCAIIGPNGAGKSTLFNTIIGEKEITSGEIYFKDQKISKTSADKRIRMGIARTFQITSFFPGMTVMENVQIALFAHHRREYDPISLSKITFRDEARSVINQVGLFKEKDDITASLSHGDQRLVDLAIALANDPVLLMLDEPTQGMAPSDKIQMMELVVSIAKAKNLTIVFTEHDMDVVFSVATKLLVMHQGRVIAEGKPDEVKRDPEVMRVYLGNDVEADDGSSN